MLTIGPVHVRFGLISLLAFVGALAVTVAGVFTAPLVIEVIISQVVHRAPGTEVIVLDPGEPARLQRDMVLAIAIPWLIVWFGLLGYRLRYGVVPSAAVAGFALAVPTPIVAAAMAIRTWLVLGLVEPSPSLLELMPSLAELCPGRWGIRFGLVTTTLFVVVLGLLTKPDGKTAGPRNQL